MVEIGNLSVFFSFLLSVYVIIASLLAAKYKSFKIHRSCENAVVAIAILLIVAVTSLLHELVTLNFNVRYVALNTSTDLTMIYRITSLWAGQAGSLLLWSFLLSLFFAITVVTDRFKDIEYKPYVNVTIAVVACFFLFLITFIENPFKTLPFTPHEGRGLNPILQNGYMAIHPLTLYFGYVGVTIPFAYGMGALLSGRIDGKWVLYSRKWFIFAWSFLSFGLLLGARWAYLELGWGGYWAWDPVENAAFMPWLTGTAFLHSVMIQERKGMLKKWNIILLITTFFLSIFGTFLTRSGIVSSVHSFAQSDIGPLFLSFIAFILLFSFGIMIYRSDSLKSENNFDSILSRESAFIFNNLLFLGAAFAVLLGTIFPIISEAVTGEKILVGEPYFNKVNVPIGLVLILLMGIGPLVSWRKSSWKTLKKNFLLPATTSLIFAVFLILIGITQIVAVISFACCWFVVITVIMEYYRGVSVRMNKGDNIIKAVITLVGRNKRRYAGYIIHIGIVLIVIGITASSVFTMQKEATLEQGDKLSLGRYDLKFEGINTYVTKSKDATVANLSVYENNKRIGEMKPEKNLYKYEGNREINQETEVALRSTYKDDLYVILADHNGKTANFRVLINPMVSWIWAGGIVLLFGASIIMVPVLSRRKE